MPEKLIYVGYVEAEGNRVFQHACNMGLEGVVGKRRESLYRSGRQKTGSNSNAPRATTFRSSPSSRSSAPVHAGLLRSISVGASKAKLLYAGKARTGYSEATARESREQLDPLIVETSPLSEPVRKPKATWVQPALDAEIEYGGLTDDGLLREAVFKGIRDDLRTVSSPPIRPRRPA